MVQLRSNSRLRDTEISNPHSILLVKYYYEYQLVCSPSTMQSVYTCGCSFLDCECTLHYYLTVRNLQIPD